MGGIFEGVVTPTPPPTSAGGAGGGNPTPPASIEPPSPPSRGENDKFWLITFGLLGAMCICCCLVCLLYMCCRHHLSEEENTGHETHWQKLSESMNLSRSRVHKGGATGGRRQGAATESPTMSGRIPSQSESTDSVQD